MYPNSLGAPAPITQPEDPGAFFVNGVDFALAGNAKDTATIRVSNQNFRAQFLVAKSDGAFTAMIANGSTRRPIANQQIRSENIFGTAQQPMPLLVPLEFTVGQGIQIDVTDVSGAPNNIHIAIIGVEY